ncbi:NADH-quinone oxidoreductase subunit N [Actinopolyspora mortivallis]|uniref:NADH-quinone oxidoreductase subunit N n=1 Tax=Actinopolyspora mortivallis TaxID=33906 RepID=UPI00035D0E81|nr:NADH-quinone oxidoreductase subunit N [Actinopolyspora mortivallis]
MESGFTALLPETILATGAVLGLLLGSWLPLRHQWPVRLMAVLACLLGLAAVFAAPPLPHPVFGGSYAVDVATQTGRVVVLGGTLLVILLSAESVRSHPRETEFHVLVQLGALGTLVLLGATDLSLLVAGYLLASVPLYALAGFRGDAVGTEAALKYYLLGALFGVVMIAGATLLYGVGRSTGYAVLARTLPTAPPSVVAIAAVALLAGLLFKAGAVPTQFWIPDVTRGADAAVAALVTTLPKIGGLVALFRLVEGVFPAGGGWPVLFALLATAAMTLGNLAALNQPTVRGLLAYSTISQVGYLLLAVTVAGESEFAGPALLYYLLAYAVTNLGAFAVVCRFPYAETPRDYRGMARWRPGAAVVLLVCLLGLVGTPPTAVFLGKLRVFVAAVDGGYGWLAAVAVVNTVISLFYYLRWLVPVFLPAVSARDGGPVPTGGRAALGGGIAASVSLLAGIGAGLFLPLLDGPVLP